MKSGPGIGSCVVEHVEEFRSSSPSTLRDTKVLAWLYVFRILRRGIALTCGTHLGATNDPASIVSRPVLARRSMSSIFVSSVMIFFSFWRPSRGPTSTSLTRLSREVLAVAKPRRRGTCDCLQALQIAERRNVIITPAC